MFGRKKEGEGVPEMRDSKDLSVAVETKDGITINLDAQVVGEIDETEFQSAVAMNIKEHDASTLLEMTEEETNDLAISIANSLAKPDVKIFIKNIVSSVELKH